MDLVHDTANIIAGEDRISNLPDDIIHHIFSFLDMKDAIQTSALSRKWKNTWTSVPHLNFDSNLFRGLRLFAKFVKDALSHRNNRSEVSALELRFTGAGNQFVVRSIVNYAYAHAVTEMTIEWSGDKVRKLPQCLFSSHTLKHLTLANTHYSTYYDTCIPDGAWDFPALETLNIRKSRLGCYHIKSLNLFSKCVNLTNLTLHKCSMFVLETFSICSPQLLDLTITDVFAFPKVLNVVAPQLKNLTASLGPDLSVYGYYGPARLGSLHLSTEGFDCLEKVNLSFSPSFYEKEISGPQLLNILHTARSAKFLILDVNIVQSISSCMDQLSHEPCPFNNLKYLRIYSTRVNPEDDVATMATQVRNYLLEQSPSATYIMDFPTLVPQKRSRQELPNDTMANKVAKLEPKEKRQETVTEVERMLEEESQIHVAEQNTTLQLQGQLIAYQETKIQMQAEVLAEEKAKLEAMESQLSQMQDEVIKFKIAELKVQVESGNPDYEVIHSMVLGFKSAMDLIPERSRVAMEAQFSSEYEELKSLFFTCINTGQWAKIESELGSLRHSERAHSSNHRSQLDIHDAELPPVPSLSSTEMAASSSNMVIQPLDSSR